MDEADDKQEAIWKLKTLPRLVGGARNNMWSLKTKMCFLYHFLPILGIKYENSFTPFFHDVVDRPHTPGC